MGTKSQRRRTDRYETYMSWMNDELKKQELVKWLEKAGVPLELRAIRVLEKYGYRCSSYHCIDSETQKSRELDIYAFKTNVKSFRIGECEVVFNVTILAECKYSYNLALLAFESKDKYFPTFPVTFSGQLMLGASYQDFDFPMIIRKIAEANVFDLKLTSNFQDRKTHQACEKLVTCFSYLHARKQQRIKVDFDKYRLFFGKPWAEFISKNFHVDQKIPKQRIGEFLKETFSSQQLLSQIQYFPIQIGFPLMIIAENRGLIKIKYDETSGVVKDFDDIGYGIYPFVSENAERYGNLLRQYFSFPVIIVNLDYLGKCLETLNEGIEKMVEHTRMLLNNNPYAIAEEVIERIYSDSIR